MTPADSDALAQAASFRMHLTTIGYDYLLHRQLFGEFLDAVQRVAAGGTAVTDVAGEVPASRAMSTTLRSR